MLALLALGLVPGCQCDCVDDPVVATECNFVVEAGTGNEISFQATEIGEESVRSWRVRNTGKGVSLVNLTAQFEPVNGDNYSVDIPENTTITVGDDETFTVTFRPLAEATLASQFVVSHPNVGNAVCPTATVTVIGEGFREIAVDAGFPDAGIVDAGPVDDAGVFDGGSIEPPDGGPILPPGGEWFAYGGFEEARARFGAVELLDGTGNILVVGGYGEDGAALDSIERLNPETGISRIVARMAVPRAEPAVATVAADGRVFITGGRSAGTEGFALRTTEIFDPINGDTLVCADVAGCGLESNDQGALSVGRIGAFAQGTATGIVVVLGRQLDPDFNEVVVDGGEVLSTSGLFTSTALTDNGLLDGRLGFTTVTDPGTASFLVVGGRDAGGAVLGNVVRVDGGAAHGVTEIAGGLDFPRAFPSAALLREAPNAGTLLVAGGFGASGAGVVEVERIVDAFGGSPVVTTVDGLELAPRVDGSLLALDGDILLWAGGMSRRVDNLNVDDSELPQTSADVLLPIGTTNILRFSTDNDLAQGRFEHRALVVGPQRDRAVFMGGIATGPRRTPHPHIERFLLTENRFLTFGLMGPGTALEAGLVAGSGAAVVSAGGTDPHDGRTSGAIRAFDATNGIYVEAGALNEPRRDHTLTRISVDEDQALLVAGGRDEAGTVLSSLSLVDPVNRIDRPLPVSLAVARAGHTATRLADDNDLGVDGAILLCGGQGPGGEALDSCEIFLPPPNPLDPATYDEADVIPVLGRLAAGRVKHTATLLDTGEVLIVGGGDVGVDLVPANLVVPNAEPFVRTTAQPILARRNHAAVFIGAGRVLIVGGDVFDNVVGATDRAELYVRGNETFIDVGLMEQQRSAPGAFLLGDGNVLVAGGSRTGADDSLPTRSNVSSELYVVGPDGTGTFEELPETDLSFGHSDVAFLDVFGRAIVTLGTHRDGRMSTGDERRTPLTFVDFLQDPADALGPDFVPPPPP